MDATFNPSIPEKSTQCKIFLDKSDNILKRLNYDGTIVPLTPEQTVKYYETKVEADADQATFVFSVPNPNKIVRELEVALKQLIDGNHKEALSNFQETLATLKSFQESQNLANGIVDSDLRDIENKISELILLVDSKVSSSDYDEPLNKLSSELITVIGNINNSLNLKATKRELESGLKEVKGLIPKIDIVAGSNNVDVSRENDTFIISVDIPKISKNIISQGGGISKSAVEQMIDSAIADISGAVTTITSVDGSIGVTSIPGGYDLAIISGGANTLAALTDVNVTGVVNGQTLKYLNGTWVASQDITGSAAATWGNIIGDIENQSDLQAALDLLTPLSTTSSISGNLQQQINNIVQEGTSIASSGGTIIVSQNVLDFNLDVADYISKTEVASISGNLQQQISAITVPTSASFLADYDARYVNESDLEVTLSDYTLLSTTSSISGSLEASKQNNITLVAGANVSIVESPTDTWTISSSGTIDNLDGGSAASIYLISQLINSGGA